MSESELERVNAELAATVSTYEATLRALHKKDSDLDKLTKKLRKVKDALKPLLCVSNLPDSFCLSQQEIITLLNALENE